MSRVFTAEELAAWVNSITATLPEGVTHWHVSLGRVYEDDRLDVWRSGSDYWSVRWGPDADGELPEADGVYHCTADQVLEDLADMSNEPDGAWQVWYWHVLNDLDRELLRLLNDVAAERDAAREADK